MSHESRTITVSGLGTCHGAPDMATLTVGVDSLAATPEEALRLNNEKSTKLIDTIKSADIEPKDIQTSAFNIYSEQEVDPKSGQVTGKMNYRVNNSVTVHIRKLDKVGEILQQAVGSGANNISGVNFSVADTSKLEAEARELAVKNARGRAEDLAKLFGVKVGKILAIQEGSSGSMPPPVFYESKRLSASDASVPIEAGQFSVTTQIQAVFAIK